MFALACVLALKLPPSDRYRVFEPLDFLTFSLFAAGSAGLAAVLSLGRLLWWTSTPWLGVVLAASIVLLCAAAWIEHNRRNPMINTRWLASADMLRLGLAILLIRLVLSEQSAGAIGFFQTLGLANTQLETLFMLMLLGGGGGGGGEGGGERMADQPGTGDRASDHRGGRHLRRQLHGCRCHPPYPP